MESALHEESSRRTEEAIPLSWFWYLAETSLALRAKAKEAANSLLNFIVVFIDVVFVVVVVVVVVVVCRLNL